MFSTRSRFDLSPNSLTLRLRQLTDQGRKIVDLTVSNPTAVHLDYPSRAILQTLGAPEVLTYDPEPSGLESARSAIRKLYAERGVQIEVRDVLLTASTSEAYAYLFKLLTDPGDRILVPEPSYPLFHFLARLESVKIVPYPLHYADDWYCDLPVLEQLAARHRPRAILIVHPNNPTGSFLQAHELALIREVCRREDAALVCDEVFADYRLDATEIVDAAADDSVLTFVLNGLSKMLLLPQLKLGWILLRGPAAARDRARERLELIADTFLSVNTVSQVALGPLLDLKDRLQETALRRLRENLEFLRRSLAGHPAQVLRIGGGWSAVVRVPSQRTDEEWCLEWLEAHGVLVHPGSFFDFPSGDHVVVSLLTEPAAFETGVRLLLETLHAFD